MHRPIVLRGSNNDFGCFELIGWVTDLSFLIIILAANAFFAAAEVSLVSVRQSSFVLWRNIDVAGAQAALNILANPGASYYQ